MSTQKLSVGESRNISEHGQHHSEQSCGAVHDSGPEHHADLIEVVGGARHQLAGAVAHVELGLHGEQAIEQVVAQVVLDIAREADQDPARPEGEDALQRNDRQGCQAVDRQRVHARRMIGRYQCAPMQARSGLSGPGAGRSLTGNP